MDVNHATANTKRDHADVTIHPCEVKADCHAVCPDQDHAVCDVTSEMCHCHGHGEVRCVDDDVCVSHCGRRDAYCHNRHHCHCGRCEGSGCQAGPRLAYVRESKLGQGRLGVDGRGHHGRGRDQDGRGQNGRGQDQDRRGQNGRAQDGRHKDGRVQGGRGQDQKVQDDSFVRGGRGQNRRGQGRRGQDDSYVHGHDDQDGNSRGQDDTDASPQGRSDQGGHGGGQGHHQDDDHSCHPSTACLSDMDCLSSCLRPAHAVCDVRSGKCHCHEYGDVPCISDDVCETFCDSPDAFCHNGHHCHCRRCGFETRPEPPHPYTFCATNHDCYPGACAEKDHATCNTATNECHCHDYGHISCVFDTDCHGPCKNSSAICYQDNHCHCKGGIEY
ncbi:uncharacterized protein LOC131954329 [Physella acuta]|uniref:uncharacterized protein LOC131954329 n=1 Tax=Physella acuta TaxID=109671 RepID=UPI0027DC93DE|nr:uncharacterized protein LOC131954329 [Physella acuta]